MNLNEKSQNFSRKLRQTSSRQAGPTKTVYVEINEAEEQKTVKQKWHNPGNVEEVI